MDEKFGKFLLTASIALIIAMTFNLKEAGVMVWVIVVLSYINAFWEGVTLIGEVYKERRKKRKK